jgi:sigma-B regulation protein RsbU (phosphoserine phosphatase)
MALVKGQLNIEIIDDAMPFDPLRDSAQPDLESAGKRPIGGLGIHLAKTLTDTMHYLRDGQGRNHLLPTKQLSGK